MIGLKREDLDEDLEFIKTKLLEFPLNSVEKLLSNIRSKKNLQFRHHARDFLIGTQCMSWNSNLITNNKRRFSWINKDKLFTPQEFIQKLESNQT